MTEKAVKEHKFTAEEFAKEYTDLCRRTGFQIAYAPQWAQSKDTGDYRLVIVASVVPTPPEKAE
jgi:hypothetical protein